MVADQQRFGGKQQAAQYFESGFFDVFKSAREHIDDRFPIAVYYAFKQSDSQLDGVASTGWDTLLSGMVNAGWCVTATWPIRTEM